ncbi:acyl carrier protein [Amycolatopsis jejuensis]|uniref:acyl carrier protein n=1 Tax=Amycolatopsis jejuensis TaxID=330084 RepID=UPI000525581D|nr:acyl carrier protein [Amycolatopsis jejuensis]
MEYGAETVLGYLTSMVADMKMVSAETLPKNVCYHETGIDSLELIDLARNISDHYGVRLSMTELITAGGLRQLSERVAERLTAASEGGR